MPVKNPGSFLDELIHSIEVQEMPQHVKLEVVLLNSGETLPEPISEKIQSVKVIPIPSSEFNHGGTRNKGVQHCEGDIIIFTVQDARFQSPFIIQGFVEKFIQYPELSAISGFQSVAWEKSNNPAKWFRPKSKPKLRIESLDKNEDWNEMDYKDRRRMCSLDNVICAYKKNKLIRFPFDETMYGEDITWGKKAILRHEQLGFHGGLRVWHYHKETWAYIKNRLMCTHFVENQLFGESYVKHSMPNWLAFYLIIFRSPSLTFYERIKWCRKEFLNYLWIQYLILFNVHKKSPLKVMVGNQN